MTGGELKRPFSFNGSQSGLPVPHQLLEFTQTHLHWVGDAIQPSHPLSSPSPSALNLSQHQGFFPNESALCIRWPTYWSFSFNISPSYKYSGLISGWISLQSKGLSRVFSNTTVQKHQFFGTQLPSQSNSHIHTWPLERYWTHFSWNQKEDFLPSPFLFNIVLGILL